MATTRAKGKPLAPATDETIKVSPEDVDRARLQWEEDAPKKYKDLLGATLPEDTNLT